MSRQHRRGSQPVRKPKKRRCAIYTRKSSEEGLEQSFNSLDAQRDACEAYCVSQKHEGWVVLDQPYDDGGLSGGSLHRPALQELLADIKAGSIDIVVIGDIDETAVAIDHEMISLIRRARCWFEDLKTGRVASIAAIARRDNVHIPEISRSISLAFLAPDMVELILSGRQPRQLTVERLRACRPLPFDWQQQHDLLLG